MRASHQQDLKLTPYHNDYKVGWICALGKNKVVAQLILDEIHPLLPIPPGHSSGYVLGRIRNHNVIITCLGDGAHDTTAYALLERQIFFTFPAIRFILLVSISGGVPSSNADIRLGDVVVSQPTGKAGAVIKYDLGKLPSSGKVKRTESQNHIPDFLLTVLATLQEDHGLREHQVVKHLSNIQKTLPGDLPGIFSRPEEDCLFKAGYTHIIPDDHITPNSCPNCDRSKLILQPK
ncbi:hypothetical protein ASPBRDRAFT_669037 [Aspergillus brasiliensis CBS 101740]|uniref:Nucleoside phosphorylase domain-containing protein n=1 Tax=Aspergillus brasiliensis (strain CBS 101740 / IMI 381727 / IBT 21946) TaxID=767769 RepID=A0A1L9UTR8_ASPBC|nr:hypothetical protein ASPBRDRAFT_669037 [Aspergillus brasiliensis CBS 101740]